MFIEVTFQNIIKIIILKTEDTLISVLLQQFNQKITKGRIMSNLLKKVKKAKKAKKAKKTDALEHIKKIKEPKVLDKKEIEKRLELPCNRDIKFAIDREKQSIRESESSINETKSIIEKTPFLAGYANSILEVIYENVKITNQKIKKLEQQLIE